MKPTFFDWGEVSSPHEIRADWRFMCPLKGGLEPIPNVTSALVALRHAPELHGAVALDAMAGKIMVRRPLPGDLPHDPAPRPFADADATKILAWLQRVDGLARLQSNAVAAAVDLVASENRWHPLREWLSGLEWDGVPRVGRWLSTYAGAPASDYVHRAGEMWLISAVARVFEPGCQVDHALVLEGVQGAGKSSLLRILGGQWFTDALPATLDNKDAAAHLQGSWIVELAEMDALGKTGTSALKSFLTRRVERFRPPYGRHEIEVARQCVFGGSINPNASGYLRDATGGRRFWPVPVGRVAIDALTRDRAQLWAETVRLYQRGVPWWPDSAFAAGAVEEQSDRLEADEWAEIVADHLAGKSVPVTVGEVAQHALRLELARLGRPEQMRISAAIVAAGWRRGRLDSQNRRRVFTPPEDHPPKTSPK